MNYIKPEDIKAYVEQNPEGIAGMSEDLAAMANHFAELIVRECIQTLRDNTPVIGEHDSVEDWDRGYIRAMVDCEHHIEEHFGFE